MTRFWNRPRFRSMHRAALAGAFFTLVVGRLSPDVGRHAALGLILFGAIYGVAVHGLMRLFTLRSWGYPVAGLLAGGVPAALIVKTGGEAGGLGLIGALFGLLLGLLEWSVLGRGDGTADAFGDRTADASGDRTADASGDRTDSA